MDPLTASLPRRRRLAALVFALGLVLLLPPGAYPADVDREIQPLIARLGSPQFRERQAAGRALDRIGAAALDALDRAAAASPDPEVRRRARALIAQIEGRQFRELRRIAAPPGSVACLALSPDGKWIATGGKERCLRLWDAETGKQVGRLTADGMGEVRCVAFTPDGKTLASGDGRVVRLWDRAAGREVRQFKGHAFAVINVAFAPDGGRCLLTSGDHPTEPARLWDTARGTELRRFKECAGIMGGWYAVFRDADRVVIRGDFAVWEFERGTGKQLSRVTIGTEPFDLHYTTHPRLAVADRGRLVVYQATYAGRPGLAGVCRIKDGTIRGLAEGNCRGKDDRVTALAAWADGPRLLLGAEERDVEGTRSVITRCRIEVWDLTSARRVYQFDAGKEPVACLALSADGRRAVSGGGRGTIRIWQLAKYRDREAVKVK